MNCQHEDLSERAKDAEKSLQAVTGKARPDIETPADLEQALDAVRLLFGQPNRTNAPVELELVFHDIRQLFGQPNRT